MAAAEVQRFEIYEGLIYVTPEIPELKTIRGYSLKPSNQVWKRHVEHEQWSWNDDEKNGPLWWDDPEEGQLEWYYEEIYRILNGEWVMIEGKPVYLNAFAYFYHQWFLTKEGDYPEYRDTSLEFLRFLELVYKDPKCRGANTMKGRRKGVSTMCMAVMLWFGITKENIEQGITSKSAIDAAKIFQLMLVNGYAGLPSFLKPRISGMELPKTILHIIKKGGVVTKGKQVSGAKEGLNNKIEHRAPGPNVFDGDGLWTLLIDEAGKFEEVKIDDYLVTASQIIHAGKQTGRILVITTVNRGDKGGDNYKKVWNGSSQLKLDSLGQTENKLYRYFIPGYMGGRDGGWIDQYGNSVWDTPTAEQTEYLKTDPNTLDPYIGCKEYCEMQRKKLANDPEKLAEEIRMFPFNPKEVFKGANNLCRFKLDDLTSQIEKIETILEDTGKKEMGRQMTFRRQLDGKAMPEDSPTGMWWILQLIENNNRVGYKNKIKCPDNVAFATSGMDTYMHTKGAIEDGSDAALLIVTRPDALDEQNSDMPIALFVGHPDTKDDFHQQIALGLEYYGIKMLAERAETSWEDYFTSPSRRLASPIEHEKKYGYLMTSKRWDGSEVYGIPSQQSKNTIEQHLTVMVEYALINMHKIKFLRLLKEMEKFDPDERTKYDVCMAFGYALIARSETVKTKNEVRESQMAVLPVRQDKTPLFLKFKQGMR